MERPFPINPVLLAIALAYTNASMVADLVLPRIQVSKSKFGYYSYDKRETFTIPDTAVGRKSRPNQISFTATQLFDETKWEGLDDPIPAGDIEDAAGTPIDPLGMATEGLSRLITLAREKRVADLVFTAGSYASGNKTQLSGNHQWNVVHADSDPIPDICTGLDACVMRPNYMAIGSGAWSAMRRNTAILKAVNRNEGGTGIAARRDVADLFELKDIFVGDAWANTAKKGQTASLAKLWGKHCLLFYKDEGVQQTNGSGITFGFTAQCGTKFAGNIPDPHIGVQGGQVVRVGENVIEKIMAADLGYFIQDAAA